MSLVRPFKNNVFLKELRGMTSILVICFVRRFQIFEILKIIFINISKNPEITEANYLYTINDG